jgi:hypothetical protein
VLFESMTDLLPAAQEHIPDRATRPCTLKRPSANLHWIKKWDIHLSRDLSCVE